MVRVQFNIFQRLVRSWEAVHPYNAAQVLKLRGIPDPRTMQRTWHDALESLGLGRVRTDRRTFSYEILNGDSDRYPVRMLPQGTILADHLTESLNIPFDDPQEPPFRPFLIPGNGEYHLGVVYQHWIADSVSIRMVLREWCARLFAPALSRGRPSRLSCDGYWDLYGPRHPQHQVDRNVLGWFRSHMRFRSVQKVRTSGPADYPVRVMLRELPIGLVDSLRKASRARNVKVSDALLAALAIASYRHLPLQHRPTRRDLAVGNILDLRSYASRDLSDTFGLFLGFTHIVCSRGDLGDFERLLRSVAMQNRARRRDGVAQSSLTWMMTALIVQRFIKPQDLYKFYRKEMPLAAGLSNVNLADSWAEQLHPSPLLDYVRISPTGPMVPLVLSATTLGSKMSLALTYRPALLDEAGASVMAQTVIDRLVEVAG